MKCHKIFILLTLMCAVLFLSACGDSDTSHVGSWSDAAMLSDDSVARHPQMAADGNGNIIAVWAQSTGFYANRFNTATGWGTPQLIADAGFSWSDIRLAVSRNGYAIFAWSQYGVNFVNVHAVRYAPGTGWGSEENITGIMTLSDLAIDDSGNAFIVAERFMSMTISGEPIGGITIARSNQASGWSYDRIESAEILTGNSFPRVSVNGSGNGFIMWVEGYYSPIKLFVSTLSPAGLGSPQQIASLPGFPAAWTNVAVDDSGNAMALWGQADSASVCHTYACRFTPAGGWGAPERIDNSPFDTIDQYLTVDPTGNFYAIWAQRTESVQTDIYSSSYSRSVGWQTPRRVGGGGNGRYPRIAADALGNVFAAWLQYDLDETLSADANVYASHYIADSGWGMQEQLKNALGGADAPALAVYQPGKAMVIWSQSTGSVNGIVEHGTFFSRYE